MERISVLKKAVYRLVQSLSLEDQVAAVCIFALKLIPIAKNERDDSEFLSVDIITCLKELTGILSPYFFLEMTQTTQISQVQEAGVIALMLAFQYQLIDIMTIISLRSDITQCFLRNEDSNMVEKWQLLMRLCWMPATHPASIPTETMTETILSNFHYLSLKSLPSSKSISVLYPHAILNSIVDDLVSNTTVEPRTLTSHSADALRSLCIQCLHGAATEHYRDETLRALVILLDTRFLDPQWTVVSSSTSQPSSTSDTSDLNRFPIFLASIIIGEIRLACEEISCFVPILAPIITPDISAEKRLQEETRLCRDLHILGQTSTLLRLCYHLLLGADDEEDVERSDSTAEIWQQCSSSVILKLRNILTEGQRLLGDLLCQLAAHGALPAFVHHRLPLLLNMYYQSVDGSDIRAREEDMEYAMKLVLTLFTTVKQIIRDGIARFVLEDEQARQFLCEKRTVDSSNTESTSLQSVWQAMLTLSSLNILPQTCPVDEYGRFVPYLEPSLTSKSTSKDSAQKLTKEEQVELIEMYEQLRGILLQEDSGYDTWFLLATILQDALVTSNPVESVGKDIDSEDEEEDGDSTETKLGKEESSALKGKMKLPAIPNPSISSSITTRLGSMIVQMSEQLLANLIEQLHQLIPIFVSTLQEQFDIDADLEDESAFIHVVSDSIYLLLHNIRLCIQESAPMLRRLARTSASPTIVSENRSDKSKAVNNIGIVTAFATLFHWSLAHEKGLETGKSSSPSLHLQAVNAFELIEHKLPTSLMTVIGVLRQYLHGQKHATSNSSSSLNIPVPKILQEVQLIQRMLMRIENAAIGQAK